MMAEDLSYLCNPYTTPYIYQSVPDRLRYLVNEDAERLAFIFYSMEGERIAVTRGQLYGKASTVAKVLHQQGVRKGTPVAVCMNNSINALYAIFGVILSGGILYLVATNLKDGSDVVERLKDCKAEYFFIDTDVDDANWLILNRIWPPNLASSDKIPTLKRIICNGDTFRDAKGRLHLVHLLTKEVPDNIELPKVFPEDILVCFCTSGSTGKPKVVICTHYQMINWTKQSAIPLEISNDTIFFCDRQLNWTVGFPRSFFSIGCTRVFVDTRMSLSGKNIYQLCDMIEKESVTVAYMPGYLAVDVVSHPEYAHKFKNVRLMFISGERISLTILPLKDTFCQKLVVLYGTTECGGFATFQSDESEDYEDGIIGIPCPGGEMKIVDGNDDVVPRGASGQICIRSPWRFSGYHGQSELFHTVLDDLGWFRPGDIGHIRKDGNMVVDGRSQELISMQTAKYFPWEIEKSLRKCPSAKFAIAVGVPDPRLLQVVCACVIPEPGVAFTEEDLKKFCDETFLEESTCASLSLKPKYFLVLNELPLTPTGKIDRRRIGIIAKNKLGL